MKIRSVLILLPIFFWNTIQAQQQTPFEEADQMFRNAKYIFEGEVVSQSFYRDSGLTCTANRIKINKIYKNGTESDDSANNILECGEVLLVTEGSSGKWVDFGDGMYMAEITHYTYYGVSTKGIFFANENTSPYIPMPPNNPTNNRVVLMSSDFMGLPKNHHYYNILDTLSLETINIVAQEQIGMQFGDMNQFYEFLATYNLDTTHFVKCPQDEAQPLPIQNNNNSGEK